MGFNILDITGRRIGWSKDLPPESLGNPENLEYIDDSLEIPISISKVRNNKINEIKSSISELIHNTDWKLQRAIEQDALGITINKTLEVYNEREAFRRASNRIESHINTLESIDEINEVIFSVIDKDLSIKKPRARSIKGVSK